MRRALAMVATLALAAAMPAAHGQQQVRKGHAAHRSVSVRLYADVGSVSVVGWDRDSVELSGVVATGSRVGFSSGTPLEAPRGIKMFVEAPSERTAREGRLTLRVPRDARVWVKTGSAALEATGVTGGLDLNVVGGSITAHGSPREVRAESMDGSVVIDGSPAWLRVKTATGDITMQGGEDVGASTISGTIRVVGGEIEHAKLEATSGAISFGPRLARGASVELETHSGGIDVYIERDASAEVDAATITGSIENGWTAKPPVPGHEGRGMTLTTSHGLAELEARIEVRSFKGTVQLHRR